MYLRPGETINNVDQNTLLFDLHKDVYDKVPLGSYSWMDKAWFKLGQQILDVSRGEKPVVIEAGFGTNTEPRGENPFNQSKSVLFERLKDAGVELDVVKWIIIGASYDIRSMRNQARMDSVPPYEFKRLAADGGDLDRKYEQRLMEEGATIRRVPNEHNNIYRFKTDIVSTFQSIYEY